MVYFFHHYELPEILQQAQLQELIMRDIRDIAQNPPGGGNGRNAPVVTETVTSEAAPSNLRSSLSEQRTSNHTSSADNSTLPVNNRLSIPIPINSSQEEISSPVINNPELSESATLSRKIFLDNLVLGLLSLISEC